jgi:hypothetical protein
MHRVLVGRGAARFRRRESGVAGEMERRRAYLDHRVVFWVYVAFTVEDVLERKSLAM